MAVTDAERLRALIGETIPPGGTASDTLLTEDQVTDLLDRYGTPELAQIEGWAIKAAALSTLVDTVEGSSIRKHSAVHKAALSQLRTMNTTAGGRVTRVHQIER
jgi:hypothetical protein